MNFVVILVFFFRNVKFVDFSFAAKDNSLEDEEGAKNPNNVGVIVKYCFSFSGKVCGENSFGPL